MSRECWRCCARKRTPTRHDRVSSVLNLDSTAKLLGEEAEIHSAFSNLVANAVKFTPTDGQHRDSLVDRTPSGGHLSVRDTGIGIAAEHIPRLTERFYRVDPGRARQHGGSGLGLAIVKHVLQRHGARLRDRERGGRGQHASPVTSRAAGWPRATCRPARAAADR